MSWSITITRIAGSEVRIHLTFLILLAWIGVAAYFTGGMAAAIDSVLFISAVFACVVLHELGHALAARRYGISTPDITLLPIGGLARLSRFPENPVQEIVIAAAGPLVNVVIAGAIFLAMGANFDPASLQTIDNPEPGFWARLAAVNIFLVLFNAIPAFPMDGGRVLRAALALWLGRRRATEIAARIGQALAFVFGFVGLIGGNAILVFIAIFVYLAATAEAGQTGLIDVTRRLKAEQAMITSFESLGPNATANDAAEAILRTTQHEFPIVDGAGHLRGVVTRQGVVEAMKQSGPETDLIEIMEREVPVIGRLRRLDGAFRLLQESRAPIVAVTEGDGRLVGYISQENITELWMLDEADWHRAPTRNA